MLGNESPSELAVCGWESIGGMGMWLPGGAVVEGTAHPMNTVTVYGRAKRPGAVQRAGTVVVTIWCEERRISAGGLGGTSELMPLM